MIMKFIDYEKYNKNICTFPKKRNHLFLLNQEIFPRVNLI